MYFQNKWRQTMHIWLNSEGNSSSDMGIIVTYVDAGTSL